MPGTTNGELLDAAEAAGFDVLLTTDRNIRYQQNLTGRGLAIVVLGKARWRLIMSFPAGIQKSFSQWQVAAAPATINDRDAQILQGTNPGQLPVNLYFDDSGLLVRSVRWSRTPVGTVPTQTDYADYREVAGVKMPFRVVVTWTNGQNTIALKEVRPNVPIDATRFATPAPFQRK